MIVLHDDANDEHDHEGDDDETQKKRTTNNVVTYTLPGTPLG